MAFLRSHGLSFVFNIGFVQLVYEFFLRFLESPDFKPTIAKKHIDRLTERFYRVDKARSRKIGGTGLGLAIVKHIVNRHRGQLYISSSPEGITCFTVRLPVLDMPESSDKSETGHKIVT